MIAIQTTNHNNALDSDRAHDGSRGSRPTHAQTTIINKSATARIPSPVADAKWDGGGAEPAQPVSQGARRRGSSSDDQTTNYKPSPTDPAPYNPAQPHKLPDDIIESNLIDALLDGSFDLPDLCIHFKLSPTELLDYLESPQTKQLLATLAKIATIRADMIASQARVAAAHRLSELARHGHITDSPREARANETARKAAAQLLRPGTTALRAVPLEVGRISERTSSARRISNPTVQHIQRRNTTPDPTIQHTQHQARTLINAHESEPRRPRRDLSRADAAAREYQEFHQKEASEGRNASCPGFCAVCTGNGLFSAFLMRARILSGSISRCCFRVARAWTQNPPPRAIPDGRDR